MGYGRWTSSPGAYWRFSPSFDGTSGGGEESPTSTVYNIRFNDTGTSVGAYEFPVNPTFYEAGSGGYYKTTEVRTLHGQIVWQKVNWDGDLRSLIWSGFYVSSAEDTSGFATQINTVEGWIGRQKYVNFGNLDNMNKNWPVSDNWKKCRIINVEKSYIDAVRSGEPRYEAVKVSIQPEE